MTSFDFCVEVILEHEGGYVNDPNDPGGETIYGISRRSHPEAWRDGTPTREQAKEIYLAHYWNPIKGDKLSPPVALCVFDAAVNQGVGWASKALQRAAGVAEDGIIGPATIKAANANPLRTAERFMVERMLRYADIKGWQHYAVGWTKRVLRVYTTARAIA